MSKGKKRKLKSAQPQANESAPKVHDRRTTDLTRNAKVAPIEVDDPHALEPGDKLIVMRSLRDDPLAAMHAAGQVDQCQYMAGRHWQKALELSEVGNVKAIDIGKEAVDGGSLADPISEPQRKAIHDLKRCDAKLGAKDAALVRDVLGKGLTIADAARKRGLWTKYRREQLGQQFRQCLDILAFVLGWSTKDPTRKAA